MRSVIKDAFSIYAKICGASAVQLKGIAAAQGFKNFSAFGVSKADAAGMIFSFDY